MCHKNRLSLQVTLRSPRVFYSLSEESSKIFFLSITYLSKRVHKNNTRVISQNFSSHISFYDEKHYVEQKHDHKSIKEYFLRYVNGERITKLV